MAEAVEEVRRKHWPRNKRINSWRRMNSCYQNEDDLESLLRRRPWEIVFQQPRPNSRHPNDPHVPPQLILSGGPYSSDIQNQARERPRALWYHITASREL